jgi:hypothetical protein
MPQTPCYITFIALHGMGESTLLIASHGMGESTLLIASHGMGD